MEDRVPKTADFNAVSFANSSLNPSSRVQTTIVISPIQSETPLLLAHHRKFHRRSPAIRFKISQIIFQFHLYTNHDSENV
jgi:hypothetical protein